MSTFKVFSYSVIKLNVLHQLDTDGQKMPYLYLLSNLYFSLILYKSRQSGLSGANNRSMLRFNILSFDFFKQIVILIVPLDQ